MNTEGKKRSLMAITIMLNSFPAQNGIDPEMLIASFLECVDDFSPEAVEEICLRYRKGEVSGHDPRFAPTTAQFTQRVKGRQDLLNTMSRKGQELPTPRKATDTSPRISKQKMQALTDCVHGRRTWESLADEYAARSGDHPESDGGVGRARGGISQKRVGE